MDGVCLYVLYMPTAPAIFSGRTAGSSPPAKRRRATSKFSLPIVTRTLGVLVDGPLEGEDGLLHICPYRRMYLDTLEVSLAVVRPYG